MYYDPNSSRWRLEKVDNTTNYNDLTDKFNKTIRETQEYFSDMAGFLDGRDMNSVERYALKLYIFAGQVGTGKAFDLKAHGYDPKIIGKRSYYNGNLVGAQDYGNYNFGVAAKAFGLSLDDALFGAGMNEVAKLFKSEEANPDFLNFRGYFDSSRATEVIIQGYYGRPFK